MQKVNLEKGEILTCTIHPIDSFPNDAMSCKSNTTDKPEYYIKKGETFDVEKLEIAVMERDREKNISSFSIKRI